jgi:hypothetical protein
MKPLFPFALALLLGCNAAGPGFRGIEPVGAEVEGSRFLIRVRDDMAEVMRINPEFPARFGPISARAQKAVYLETGCIPAWVSGDPAMMVMGLSCDGRAAPKQPGGSVLSCEIYDAFVTEGLGGTAAVECREG